MHTDTDTNTDTHTDTQTHRHTDTQTRRHTDTDKDTDTDTHSSLLAALLALTHRTFTICLWSACAA